MKRTELRERLATLLAQPGWSQKVLAERSGVDQSTVSRIVNGKRGCGIDTLEKLMPFLPCTDQHSMPQENRQ